MSRRAPLVCWVLCVVLTVPAIALVALGPEMPVRDDTFGRTGGFSFLVLGLAYATVGAVLATRVPGNRIGWGFCATGLVFAVTMLAYGYADYGLHVRGDPLPGAVAAATVPSEPMAALLGLTLLFFPDGHLPSPRWRPVAAMLALASVVFVVGDLLRPGAFDQPFAVASNPLGVHGWRGAMDGLRTAGWCLIVPATALAAASMVTRLRRAHGVERQQLKLVLAVGAVVALVTALDMASWLLWPHGDVQLRMGVIGLSFVGFPVAAGVAILRYRLYEIDVVINRTLVYGALTAVLAGTYLGTVLVLQLLLSGLTSGSSIAVALSTLAAAALFRPLRRRVQQLVDRRFYRHRYDAQRTLEAFSARLRHEADLGSVDAELGAAVRDALRPAHVSLWLRPPAPGEHDVG